MAQEKLNEAKKRIGLCMESLSSPSERFKCLCIIRDSILKDSVIEFACKHDEKLVEQRRSLLDQIKNLQLDIVNSLFSDNAKNKDVRDSQINDFEKAKKALSQIAEAEKCVLDTNSALQSQTEFQIPNLAEHLLTIEEVIDNCQNSRYNVLLMAGTQTGKTTTLNALSGGIEVGAIGDGTTTTAVPTTLSYNETQSINVVWKTETELFDTIALVYGYVPNFNFKDFSLSDPQKRDELYQRIEEIRKDLNKKDNPGDYSKDVIQSLTICSIILKYYGSSTYAEKINAQYSLDQIASLTRFPKNLYKWFEKGISTFSIEEILFAFVKLVECKFPALPLKDIHGTIVDCPGLFANTFDKSVTEHAMMKADAILFIMPREREISAEVQDALKRIKNNYSDFRRKLIVANNLSITDKNSESIFDANQTTIDLTIGKGFSLIPYDALMAYWGEVKLAHDNNFLDKKKIANIITLAQGNAKNSFKNNEKKSFFYRNRPSNKAITDFSSAWRELTSDYAEFDDLVASSGLNKVIDNINSFIAANNAYSVIIAFGAEKLRKELCQIKTKLKSNYVDTYIDGKTATESKWSSYIQIAEKFEEDAKKIVESSLFESKDGVPSLCSELSDSIYKKLFTESFYNDLIDDTCKSLFNELDKINELKNNSQEQDKKINSIINRCCENAYAKRVYIYWKELLTTGQDHDFNNIFIPRIDLLEIKLDNRWKELYRNYSDFASNRSHYYNIDKKSAICFETNKTPNSNNEKYDVDIKEDLNTSQNISKVSTGVFIGGTIAYIGITIFTGGWGLLVGPCEWLASIIGTGRIEEKREAKFLKDVKPTIGEAVKAKVPNIFRDKLGVLIKDLMTNYATHISFDRKLLLDDKDKAIYSSGSPLVEANCLSALASVEEINKQIQIYSSFISEVTYDKTN